jgi:hypothetical protein
MELTPQTTEPQRNSQEAVVSVHALSTGHFTLPEHQFIYPIPKDARKRVPSLAFLVQHHHRGTGKVTRIVFDLGLRKDVKRYAGPIQKHIETRQPLNTCPDVVESLAKGGLRPVDIDFVIYSHVSWQSQSFPGFVLTVIVRSIGTTLVSLGTFLRQHSWSVMALWLC